MGMRRAQQLHVQDARRRDIERETRAAGHHLRPGRRRQAVPAGFARLGVLDMGCAPIASLIAR